MMDPRSFLDGIIPDLLSDGSPSAGDLVADLLSGESTGFTLNRQTAFWNELVPVNPCPATGETLLEQDSGPRGPLGKFFERVCYGEGMSLPMRLPIVCRPDLEARGLRVAQEAGGAFLANTYSVAVAFELGEAVPLADPERTMIFAAVFDGDGDAANNFRALPDFPLDFFDNTDQWYGLEFTPSDTWRVEKGSPEMECS